MTTLTVCIGNTDNKLSQAEWACFVQEIRMHLPNEVHFEGGSSYDVPWQTACWVVETDTPNDVYPGLTEIRKRYNQDAVAAICGTTEFI